MAALDTLGNESGHHRHQLSEAESRESLVDIPRDENMITLQNIKHLRSTVDLYEYSSDSDSRRSGAGGKHHHRRRRANHRRSPASSRKNILLAAITLIALYQLQCFKRANSASFILWSRSGDFSSSKDEYEPGRPPLHKAVLSPQEVLPRSPDECADIFKIPKVAILVLTTGEIPLEESWRLWFRSAGGLLPATAAKATVCNATSTFHDGAAHASRACTKFAANPIDQQHLFSVYVHAPPQFNGLKGSLFDKYLISHRVETQWGSHSLVEATRNLLWEAYRDPLNTKFVLVSEADIPLYDPLTFYQQILGEAKSRIDTCRHLRTSPWRYDPRMMRYDSRLTLEKWRKSSQWATLTRDHVNVVLNDEAVFHSFEEYCWSAYDDTRQIWLKDCFSDVHYIPTLLAIEGREDEGVCESTGVAYAEWVERFPRPRQFTDDVIDADFIIRARRAQPSATGVGTPECRWNEAYKQAQDAFVSLESALNDLNENSGSGGSSAHSVFCSDVAAKSKVFKAVLAPSCPLTARKFPASASERIRRVFLQCGNSGVSLLRGDICQLEGGKRCDTLWGKMKQIVSRDC